MSVSTDQSVMPVSDEQTAPESNEAVAAVVESTETAEAVEAVAGTGSAEPAEAAVDVTEDTADEAAADDEAASDEAPQITFADLGLDEKIVRKLAQNGVTTPFPIQAATIPDALAGRDILGRGRTGSGKTLSFGLPLLGRLAGGFTEKKRPRGIILTPTRELAMQVSDALQPYGDVLGLKLKVVCGGTSMGNQIYALERGVDVLVATPGRLRDIINRGACSLDKVEVAVLDEADQMADLGFLPEVTELLDLVPTGGQRMLFSATMENEIGTLVKRYLTNPVSHEVDAAQGAVTTMTHHVLVVKPKDKAPVTAAIAARKGRTIIFVRTQLGADRVAEQLREAGVRADALHGGMTQGARTRTLADFKDGYVNVLVATDVAARGIHVDGIDLVLNVDPAGDHKDYLHRSGRTARAGRSGTVVSLSLPHQRRQIFRLMEDAGVDASRHIVGGAGAFDEDVARITGARSLTEVQAESASNSAKQAEREVRELSRELERVQRRAAELREEANRLTARAARERGEDPEAAVAAATAAAEAAAPADADAAETSVPAQPRATEDDEAPRRSSYERRDERRDERGGYDRREDRGGYERREDRGGYDRRDERGNFERRDRRDSDRGGFGRDRRDDRPGRPFNRDDRSGGGFGRDRRDDRPGRPFNRDDRSGGGFSRDRRDSDRGGFGRDRRDERPGRPFNRDDRSGGGFSRDRRDSDRGGFGRDRRDDRPGRPFNRDDRSGGRPSSGGYRSGGGDRPFNRDDRSGGRPSTGGYRSGGDRPYGRRDDHRGTGTGTGSFGRRDDKPRWKRNG
ncbi:DEAD/DEAH box helicase [Streptomyces sp. MST-110588]|uniref:DEAD/DEAH box helicase n=1 Tax=Streptomyces sp. MST-110588 TaxID=2833628 RepID=UPI001F5DC44F|nr:DEAD/DEAH box helicase [Streptomyces sp. MST-110588]UNO41188.1 DEAD/DEAH box helicase [Streptomyces sp. MST-110588]